MAYQNTRKCANKAKSRRSISWILILAYFLISFALIAAGLGKVLNFVYPFLGLSIGFFLYSRDSIFYIGFTWWSWILSPLIRRLADFNSAFTDPSPILLAPLLITLVSGISFFRNPPTLKRGNDVCFLIAIYSLFYGFFIGILQGSVDSSLLSLIEVTTPVFFGYYFYANWELYPIHSRVVQQVFCWGVLITGIYGVFQFLTAPQWDTFWLVSLYPDASILGTAFGTPEPLGIRVWSTMNGPLDYAVFMMCGLVILFSYSSPILFPASAFGYLSFLLTQVRSAWGGWLICLLLMIFSLKQSLQLKLIATFAILLLAVAPLLIVEPFSSIIAERFDTFTNITNDSSGNTRIETYKLLMSFISANIVGIGLGNKPSIEGLVVLDSSLLQMLIQLGLIGAFLYFFGYSTLTFILAFSKDSKSDIFAAGTLSIILSSFLLILLGPVMIGVSGVTLWSFLGMGNASARYYRNQKLIKNNP